MLHGALASTGVTMSLLLIVQCSQPANTLLDQKDGEQSGRISSTYHKPCMDRRECSGHLLEYCDLHSRCECRPQAQYNNSQLVCLPCPDEGVPCTECCTATGYQCVGGKCVNCYENDNWFHCWPDLTTPQPPPLSPPTQTTVIYINVSQIAITAALILGSIALVTLLYRICSKPASRHSSSSAYTAADSRATNARNCRAPQQQPRLSDGHLQTAFQRLSQRLSLTSMQARIMQRLRDQPPKYESPANYDARMRQQQAQLADEPNAPQPPVVVVVVDANRPLRGTANSSACNEMQSISLSVPATVEARQQQSGWPSYSTSPPCYDNDAYSLSDLPPPYTAEQTGPGPENIH